MKLHPIFWWGILAGLSPTSGQPTQAAVQTLNVTAGMARFWTQANVDCAEKSCELLSNGRWEFPVVRVPPSTVTGLFFMDRVCKKVTVLTVNPDNFRAEPIDFRTISVADPSGMTVYQREVTSASGSASLDDHGLQIDFPSTAQSKAVAVFCTDMSLSDYVFLYKVVPLSFENSTAVASVSLDFGKQLAFSQIALQFVLPPKASLLFSLTGGPAAANFTLTGTVPPAVQISALPSPATTYEYNPNTSIMTLISGSLSVSLTNTLPTTQTLTLVLHGQVGADLNQVLAAELQNRTWQIMLAVLWLLFFTSMSVFWCIARAIRKKTDRIAYVFFDSQDSSFLAARY